MSVRTGARVCGAVECPGPGAEGSADDGVAAGGSGDAGDAVVEAACPAALVGAAAAPVREADDPQAVTPMVDTARTAAATDALTFMGFLPGKSHTSRSQ
jgi:hypothetical protein